MFLAVSMLWLPGPDGRTLVCILLFTIGMHYGHSVSCACSAEKRLHSVNTVVVGNVFILDSCVIYAILPCLFRFTARRPTQACFDKIDSRDFVLSVCPVTHQLHTVRTVLFDSHNHSGATLQIHLALTSAKPVLVDKA